MRERKSTLEVRNHAANIYFTMLILVHNNIQPIFNTLNLNEDGKDHYTCNDVGLM